jgi:hypothetical protein
MENLRKSQSPECLLPNTAKVQVHGLNKRANVVRPRQPDPLKIPNYTTLSNDRVATIPVIAGRRVHGRW